MPAEKLTDIQCRNAKPGTGSQGQPIPRMYSDGKGLLLRVGPSGSKSWVYRYKMDGKARDLGLGPYPERTLADARELAMAQRRLRLDGHDPLARKRAAIAERRAATRAEAERKTFRQAAEAWIEAKEAEWTMKHRGDIVLSLGKHVYPVIGDMPVGEVDTPAILRTIEPKWLTLTETMSRVRSRIESVLGYAMTKGYREPGANPARWEQHLENLLPKKSKVAKPVRYPKLDDADLPAFMAALRERKGLPARALEFTILTAARAGEVIGTTWSEFDLERRVWTIPAERMKAGVEHRVPLSDAALAILAALQPTGPSAQPSMRDGELVFGRLVNNSLIRLLDTFKLTNAAGEKPVVHGFRGAFSTWAAECKYPYEVRELALAHKVGSHVERSYNTADLLDDRRRLMAAWADHCAGIAEAKVVQLRA